MSPAPLFSQPASQALESLQAEQGPDGSAIYRTLALLVIAAALALPWIEVDRTVAGRAWVSRRETNGNLLLEARLREADARVVRDGASARLSYDALPGMEWGHAPGRVLTKAPAPDPLTGLVAVELASSASTLTNADGVSAELHAPMGATARIVVGRRSLLRLLCERGSLSSR